MISDKNNNCGDNRKLMSCETTSIQPVVAPEVATSSVTTSVQPSTADAPQICTTCLKVIGLIIISDKKMTRK